MNERVIYVGPGSSGRRTSLEAVLVSSSQIQPSFPRDAKNPTYTFAIEVDGMISRVEASASRAGVGYPVAQEPDPFGDCTGLIFVVDSRQHRREANIAEVELIVEQLIVHRRSIEMIPIVFQVNKRDSPEIVSMEWVKANLHVKHCDYVESIATKGVGTMAALTALVRLIREMSKAST